MQRFYSLRVKIPKRNGDTTEVTYNIGTYSQRELFLQKLPEGVKVEATSIDHLLTAADAVKEIKEMMEI